MSVAYPGRRVVTVEARELFARGARGALHHTTAAESPRGMICEASIGDLVAALDAGRATSEALVAACMARIEACDRAGPCLNSIPVQNPAMWDEARASDARRAAGQVLGPLDGIPYTAKNSFKAKGLTCAAGSPAFADLIAGDEAFAIERLRAAGAVLIGLTNMPPMANGGMQRGVYGRAESPCSSEWLTSTFVSGSSNGTGTATAPSFAAFRLAEETWSSGRAPAALNGLVAHTPSCGVLSMRGNWPLVPTMDVQVPYARCTVDILMLLDVLVADDPQTRGDFWRDQPWLPIPKASNHRPPSYPALAQGATLQGVRLGVPRMYINADPEAGTAEIPGIGGPTGQRIEAHASVMELWRLARRALEQAGAEVVEADFPLVTNYEGDRPVAPKIHTRGLVCAEYLKREIIDLSVFFWDEFLRANADPNLNRLADVDGAQIFPHLPGTLPDRYTGFDDDIASYPAHARAHPCDDYRTIPHLAEGLRGLEDWMGAQGLEGAGVPGLGRCLAG